MLENLMLENQPAYSYAWFVTVALSRLHGIHWTATKKARAALRMVRLAQPAPAEPEQQTFAAELLSEATARVKGMK